MEDDDDSGQWLFLPHIFFPDMWHLVSDHKTMQSTHSPAQNPQLECDAVTLQKVPSGGKLSSSVRLLRWIQTASYSMYLMESFAVNEYTQRSPNRHEGLTAVSVGLLTNSLLQPQMSPSISLCQDVCDTAWLNVECVCTWEAFLDNMPQKADYGSRIWYIHIQWSSQFMCVWIVFFSLSCSPMKIPIKSIANCAIIHSPYPAGYQIPSGVIDQNKTETQTNTHTHTALSHWPTL